MTLSEEPGSRDSAVTKNRDSDKVCVAIKVKFNPRAMWKEVNKGVSSHASPVT